MVSLYDALLREGARRFGGGRTLYHYEGAPYTFAQVLDRCERRAAQLAALGVAWGDAVLLALPDCVELVALFYALIKLGAKPLCVSELNRRQSLLGYAESARAAALFLPASDAELLSSLRAEDPGLDLFTVETGGGEDGAPVPVFRTAAPIALPIEDDAVAYLTATSGSSGRPKVIPNRHDRVLRGMRRFALDTLGLRPDDVLLSASKISYTYGLANNVLVPPLTGAAALLFRPRTKPPVLYEQTRAYRPTVFFAVPAVFSAILQDGARSDGFYTGDLRLCLSSGDALTKSVARSWRDRFGLNLMDATGCSETCIAYLMNRDTCGETAGSAGRPMDGFQVKLVSEDPGGAPCSTGVLWVRGDCAADRYLHNPSATARKFRDGWVVTNDVFTVDAEGRYWFEGRSDHLLKLNGLWVSTLEIRDALLQNDLVSEAEVLKITLEERDRMVAFVTLTRPSGDCEALLQSDLRARLAKYKCPWRIRAVEAMPRTLNGKTDKRALCAWFRAQAGAAPNDTQESAASPLF